MQIKCSCAVAELGDADRIEPARDRLAEIALSLEPAALHRAEAVSVLIEEGVCALLAAWYERSHHVPVHVNLIETLCCYSRTTFLGHDRREDMIVLLYGLGLTLLHRSTAVADHAAAALALLVVAGEIFCKHFL